MGWKCVITNSGADLFSRSIQGTTIIVDAAKAGTETMPVELMMSQTAMAGATHDLVICRQYKVLGLPQYCAVVQITPETEAAFVIRQIGIWGHLDDEEDVLIALYQAEAESDAISVPKMSDMADFIFEYSAYFYVWGTGALTIEADTTALVSRAELEEALSRVRVHPARVTVTMDGYQPPIDLGNGTELVTDDTSTGAEGEWHAPGETWTQRHRMPPPYSSVEREFTAPSGEYACVFYVGSASVSSGIVESWFSAGAEGIVTPINYETFDYWIMLTTITRPTCDVTMVLQLM